MPPVSLYQQHADRWKGGCGSANCGRGRTRVCLARGTVPCDVLFVGEAPGESENVLGKPFVGPAGKLLDHVIAKALGNPPPLRLAFTNLVGCIPREEDGSKSTEPDHDDVMACAPRLTEFIGLCNPRLLVCVGKLAREYVGSRSLNGVQLPDRLLGRVRIVNIHHPAFILRMNVAQQGLEVQRCVVTLSNAVGDL